MLNNPRHRQAITGDRAATATLAREGRSELDQLRQLFAPAPSDPSDEAEVRSRVARAVDSFLGQSAVHQGLDGVTVAGGLAGDLPAPQPHTVDSYADYVIQQIVRHSINTASPRCLGHMSGITPRFARILAEVVVGLNQNLVKFEASTAVTELERHTAAILHRATFRRSESYYRAHAHREKSVLGIFSSGGTLANLMALWCARNRCLAPSDTFAGVEHEGMTHASAHHRVADVVVIASVLAHYSVSKAAGLLGLGERNLLQIPVDAQGAMALDALEETIADCKRAGRRIMAIVGIAGTTESGSIDPLVELGTVAMREGAHFHIDAAWGGSLLFSPTQRPKLAGIEQADSVAIDAHKQLHMPIGANVLLFRDARAAYAFEKNSLYVLRHDSDDLGKWSVEGSRSANSLMVHAALGLIGPEGYAQLIDAYVALAEEMARIIRDSSSFELLMAPQTNIVLYRYLPPGTASNGGAAAADQASLNDFNTALQNRQFEDGRSFVARTMLTSLRAYCGQPIVALRAVLNNPHTTVDDLREVLADQERIAAELLNR